MLITAGNGPTVTLRPVRWQFPPDAGEWDDRWLIITGTIDLGPRTWSFTDPCLVIEEAHDLATWLHRTAEDHGQPHHADGPPLTFMEPALSFSTKARNDGRITISIHFTAEAAPPWLHADNPHAAHQTVDLILQPDQVRAAADLWTSDLKALPTRIFTTTEQPQPARYVARPTTNPGPPAQITHRSQDNHQPGANAPTAHEAEQPCTHRERETMQDRGPG